MHKTLSSVSGLAHYYSTQSPEQSTSGCASVSANELRPSRQLKGSFGGGSFGGWARERIESLKAAECV